MIPLRRQLIVKEHGNLLYPEGTACADVLVAGEKGGSFASRVFYGLGLGGVYTLFQNGNAFAADQGDRRPTTRPGCPGRRCAPPSPSEYLGVGLHHRARGSRGRSSRAASSPGWCMMPAIKFFGSLVPTPIYPSPIPIAQMTSDQLWNYYIRYIGAGAVAAAGLITLIKTAAHDRGRAHGAGSGRDRKEGGGAAAGRGPHRPRPAAARSCSAARR